MPTGSTSLTAEVSELGEQMGGLLQGWKVRLTVVVAEPPVCAFVAVTVTGTDCTVGEGVAAGAPSRRQISPLAGSTVMILYIVHKKEVTTLDHVSFCSVDQII